MATPPAPIRVAFRRGAFDKIEEAVVMACEGGGRYIHAEVWLGDLGFSAYYRSTEPCVLGHYAPPPGAQPPPQWDVYPIPIAQPHRAVAFMRAFCATQAVYDIPLSDFVVPRRLLDAWWDPDLDCTRPDTWRTLFCSQFVLLFLRRCVVENLLQDPKRVLWSVNSHVCSPAHLGAMLEQLLRPPPSRPPAPPPHRQ